MNIRYTILSICILILFACAPTKVKIYPSETPPAKTMPERTPSESVSKEKTPIVKPAQEKTYDETVFEWKSYQDVVKWMENNYSVDIKRFEGKPPIARISSETFQLKSGSDIDAALFLKETLKRINPSYQAQIAIVIIRPNTFNRYVCSFKKDGKLFIMNYGTPYKQLTGVYGPYNSLEEYRQFFDQHNPTKSVIEGIIHLR